MGYSYRTAEVFRWELSRAEMRANPELAAALEACLRAPFSALPKKLLPFEDDVADGHWFLVRRVRDSLSEMELYTFQRARMQPHEQVSDAEPAKPAEEWWWVHSGGTQRSCIFRTLEAALAGAEQYANPTRPVEIQWWKNGRMEVVWYGWDAHNRLRPAHTLPKVVIDPNTYED